MTHRVTHKRIKRPDGVYEKGDTFEPTEAELESFSDRLEAVDEDDESGTLPFNPESNTNDEVAEKVEDIEEESTLRALLNLERQQKDRTGAIEAIEARLDEV